MDNNTTNKINSFNNSSIANYDAESNNSSDYLDNWSTSQFESHCKINNVGNKFLDIIDKEEKVQDNGLTIEEKYDIDISILFQEARTKLEKMNFDIKQQKKKIIEELARNLEGKIKTDTICMEIVSQLRGQVSERFIHKCLDEKYKQKPRVNNAKKQRKKDSLEQEIVVGDSLAAVAPLNPNSEYIGKGPRRST